MDSEKLLKVEEVALMVGVSVQTVNIWYRWRNAEPNNEYAKLLPDFVQNGERQTRYWKQSDIWKLIEFRRSIPTGRNGVMGQITQQYIRNRKVK